MSSIDDVPIYHFVMMKYLSAPVQKLVEGWRIEPNLVIDRLVDHFREMGIYKVAKTYEPIITKSLMWQLRNSPDIRGLVNRAQHDEQRRQRNRHAD